MPRDGSNKPPSPAGSDGPSPEFVTALGELAKPRFAVLPNPARLFDRRRLRFEALAPGHDLEPYLKFLARLCAAQQAVAAEAPLPPLPAPERIAQALEHALPPLSFGQVELDAAADAAFTGIARRIGEDRINDASAAAAATVTTASAETRQAMMRAVLMDEVPSDAIAPHVLAAAAVQVHFARLAAQLDPNALQPVADGACPACGSGPVASEVVGWPEAPAARYCACSVCATQWNVVRIKCLTCGNDKGLTYKSLEGGTETIQGESCPSCRSYVKILQQHQDTQLEPVADDVASLALDLVLGREGWQRASANPFLLGY